MLPAPWPATVSHRHNFALESARRPRTKVSAALFAPRYCFKASEYLPIKRSCRGLNRLLQYAQPRARVPIVVAASRSGEPSPGKLNNLKEGYRPRQEAHLPVLKPIGWRNIFFKRGRRHRRGCVRLRVARVAPESSVARSTPHSATVSCPRKDRARSSGARRGGGVADTAGEGAVAFVNGSVVVIVSLLQFLLRKYISKKRESPLSLSLSPFHEFLFKAFCTRLSIRVDVEWTLRSHGADQEITGRFSH